MAPSEREFYFQRFGFCERQIPTPPPPELGLVVVIPCFNEPDLLTSLESLWQCERAACAVEVIVVINSAIDSSDAVRAQNQRTFEEATAWATDHSDNRLGFHVLRFADLPPKQAGVGLARKIGMDEAARRFDDVRKPGGIIVCYDADCQCARNYLAGIEGHFQLNPRSPGCSIYFEHPLGGVEETEADRGIALYELHLRYYVQGLRQAGFPYAHHTIGSCMAVRAGVYKEQGGMNKRQAGEDFYFLQKIIRLGHFTDLTATTVIPSPRASDRVPFGTGRAIREYLKEQRSWTYPLEAFLDLKKFFDHLPELFRGTDLSSATTPGFLPESVRAFFQPGVLQQAMSEIRENTSSESAFRKRFFHWFNAFQAMKFIHHARDHVYGQKVTAQVVGQASRLPAGRLAPDPTYAGETPDDAGETPAPLPEQLRQKSVTEEAGRLLAVLRNPHSTAPVNLTPRELLAFYREIERKAPPLPLQRQKSQRNCSVDEWNI